MYKVTHFDAKCLKLRSFEMYVASRNCPKFTAAQWRVQGGGEGAAQSVTREHVARIAWTLFDGRDHTFS